MSSRNRTGGGRARILEAATAVILNGESLTMSAVAAAAGVSRQAVYLHFANRPALAVAAARYTDEQLGLADAVRPMEAASDPETLLSAYAEFLADYNPRIRNIVGVVKALRRDDPALRDAWLDRVRNRRRATRRMARRLARWGRLAPGFTVATAGDWLAAQGSVELWEELVVDLGWSRQRFVEVMAKTFRRTLLVPSEALDDPGQAAGNSSST